MILSNPSALLRLPAVLAQRGVRKTQHYDDIKNGLFPAPVKLGPRASAWPVSEVIAINKARIAGKSDEDVKFLVKKLMASRALIYSQESANTTSQA